MSVGRLDLSVEKMADQLVVWLVGRKVVLSDDLTLGSQSDWKKADQMARKMADWMAASLVS
jgi:hypothetical protein